MAPEDPRLPSMTMGSGLVVNRMACCYPHAEIEQQVIDDWNEQTLQVLLNHLDGIASATWAVG